MLSIFHSISHFRESKHGKFRIITCREMHITTCVNSITGVGTFSRLLIYKKYTAVPFPDIVNELLVLCHGE